MPAEFSAGKPMRSFVRINNRKPSQDNSTNTPPILLDLSRVTNIQPVRNIPPVFVREMDWRNNNNHPKSTMESENSEKKIQVTNSTINNEEKSKCRPILKARKNNSAILINQIILANNVLIHENKKLRCDLQKFRYLFKNKDRTVLYELIKRLDEDLKKD